MKITTINNKGLNVSEDDIITIPDGLIGFYRFKRFVLLDYIKDTPFKQLQSLERSRLAFIVINPLLINPEYKITISKADLTDIALEDSKFSNILSIVNMPEDLQLMTANLQAPVIINEQNMIGKQIVLASSCYSTKYKIFQKKNRLFNPVCTV